MSSFSTLRLQVDLKSVARDFLEMLSSYTLFCHWSENHWYLLAMTICEEVKLDLPLVSNMWSHVLLKQLVNVKGLPEIGQYRMHLQYLNHHHVRQDSHQSMIIINSTIIRFAMFGSLVLSLVLVTVGVRGQVRGTFILPKILMLLITLKHNEDEPGW